MKISRFRNVLALVAVSQWVFLSSVGGAAAVHQATPPQQVPAQQVPAQMSASKGSASKGAAFKRALPLSVSGAVVRAVPPLAGETAAYATLKNTGTTPLKLVGAASAVAGHTMLMQTTRAGGMMGMQMVDALTIPAGGTLTLKPDGDHLMLMKLKRPLRVGEKLTLTLRDSSGRTFTFTASVQKP